MMRKVFVFSWLAIILSGIVALFWYNEWKYNLPTPVPRGYVATATGTFIHLPYVDKAGNSKPVFLHFFNPDCPCSRFNMEHVRALIKTYGNEVNFKMVLVNSKNYSDKEIQRRFDVNIPVLRDTALAAACGVYSTPQAVILDAQQKLFYRGNYNRSRYCADKKTNFAQAALEALLQHNYNMAFDPLAIKAYGCQLPGCRN
jgi:hypothetical protein